MDHLPVLSRWRDESFLSRWRDGLSGGCGRLGAGNAGESSGGCGRLGVGVATESSGGGVVVGWVRAMLAGCLCHLER